MWFGFLIFLVVQEFWIGNEELVHLYEKRLGAAGYLSFKLGRTNNRGDGMLLMNNELFDLVSLGLLWSFRFGRIILFTRKSNLSVTQPIWFRFI